MWRRTGTSRWGIEAGPLAWQPARSGWTLRNGFAPDAIGSGVSTSTGVEVPASYVSLTLSGLPVGTVFQGVTLTFYEVTYLFPNNAWAGTSADGFAAATRLTYFVTGESRGLAVSLPDTFLLGLDPFEIRIYGVVGSEVGAFQLLNVTGDLVPEPDLRWLLTAVALGWATAFRHRRGAMPRR